jgi:hypothetical protein
MRIVLDLDDFVDSRIELLNPILKLKEVIPQLKVTLFCIPKSLSDSVAKKVLSYGFFELVQHGWSHGLYECKNLLYQQALDILEAGYRDYFVKGFKAPNWLCSHAMMKVLREKNYWLAIHPKQIELAKQVKVRSYLYTQTIENEWKDNLIYATGHVEKCVCGDSIEENLKNLLKLPKDAEYKFISEVV